MGKEGGGWKERGVKRERRGRRKRGSGRELQLSSSVFNSFLRTTTALSSLQYIPESCTMDTSFQ